MKLNKLLAVILLSATTVVAQDIGTTQVKVVEGFKPTIPEAARLNEKAVFADTLKKDRTQEYKVVESDLESDYKTRPLKAAKVKADKIPELYATKISLGFGDNWNSRATVLYNSKRSETVSYGVLLNHFANKYEAPFKYEGVGAQPQVALQEYLVLVKNSKNTMHLYGKKIGGKHIFVSNLDYDRRTATYWPQSQYASEENFVNRFAYTKFSVSAISKELSVDKLKHNTQFFISDLNEFSENQIHLSSHLSKIINGLPYTLEVELNNYINYARAETAFGKDKIDTKEIHLAPSAAITKFGLDLDLGMEFHYQANASESNLEVFPQVKVTKELVKDVLLVYGGLRHSEKRHTLKSLSDENPYIHSYGANQSILGNSTVSQGLRTTDSDEFYVVMRNLLGKGEVFEGSIAYGWINEFAHFVGERNVYDRFLINYINLTQLHVNINYNRKINDLVSLEAKADYYNWDKEVYYKPNLICGISAPVNLRNKIKVIPSLRYLGERVSKVGESSIESNDNFILSFTELAIAKLPAQIHADLGVYYNYSKQLSAYLQLNNLTNSKQELWMNHQEIGFNGVLGLSYSF